MHSGKDIGESKEADTSYHQKTAASQDKKPTKDIEKHIL
jgi:hypothetical protein